MPEPTNTYRVLASFLGFTPEATPTVSEEQLKDVHCDIAWLLESGAIQPTGMFHHEPTSEEYATEVDGLQKALETSHAENDGLRKENADLRGKLDRAMDSLVRARKIGEAGQAPVMQAQVATAVGPATEATPTPIPPGAPTQVIQPGGPGQPRQAVFAPPRRIAADMKPPPTEVAPPQ